MNHREGGARERVSPSWFRPPAFRASHQRLPFSILILFVAGPLGIYPHACPAGAAPEARTYYEAVLHQSGAVEKLWPLENVIVVAFTGAATPDSYGDLAESEGLQLATELKHALADHAAIYVLDDDQSFPVVRERVERHP